MRHSSKPIYWTTSGVMALATATVFLLNYRGEILQNSLESGLFEKQYLSIIHALNNEMAAIETQRHGNNPTILKIPQQEQMEALEPEPVLSKTHQDIILQGVYLSETIPLAQINEKLCKIGDQIGELTLEYIDPYQIRLRSPSGEIKTVVLETSRGGVNEPF